MNKRNTYGSTLNRTLQQGWTGISEYLFENQLLLYIILIVISYSIIKNSVMEYAGLFHRPVTVTLAAPNGMFASTHPAEQSGISIDRERALEWESFHLQKIDSATWKLLDHWDREMEVDPNGMIRAGSPPHDNARGFYLFLPPEGGCLIGNRQQQYWSLSPENQRVIAGPAEQAIRFTPVIVDTSVPIRHQGLLLTALVCLAISLIVFRYPRWELYAIIPLILAAFFYRLYAISLHDFLFVWDEQYHAVVARNLVEHPWKPMFYKQTVMPYLYQNWIGNHIWLHKQPLFLWQMAFFINLFGEEAWVIRIPDLIATTLMVWIIYRMGSLLIHRRAGFIGSLLFSGSYFLFTLTSGSQFTDHNDVIFLFYITLSLWAWLEYVNSTKRKWQIVFLLLAGLFAGCAILNKWLVGLLLYSGWGIYILTGRLRRRDWKQYADLAISLAICLLVFLPWQLYILHAFPVESRYEFALNTEHFFSAVEGHGSEDLGAWYYFANFKPTFGVSLLLGCAGILMLLFLARRRGEKWAVFTWIAIIFLFYTMAATKMPAFPFIVSPLIYLCVGALLWYMEVAIDFIVRNKIVASLFFIAMVWLVADRVMDINSVFDQNYYKARMPDSCPYQRRAFAEAFRKMDESIPVSEQQTYVVMNCPWEEIGQMLFYTHVMVAYGSLDEYNFSVLKKGTEYPVRYLIYNDKPIPDFILNDTTVVFLSIGKLNFDDEDLACTD